MGKTISFLENDSDIIQKYIQDYKELKAFMRIYGVYIKKYVC